MNSPVLEFIHRAVTFGTPWRSATGVGGKVWATVGVETMLEMALSFPSSSTALMASQQVSPWNSAMIALKTSGVPAGEGRGGSIHQALIHQDGVSAGSWVEYLRR